MHCPEEISKFKIKLKYLGRSTNRSTNRFTLGRIYEGTYVFGAERGYKASSLDYIVLSDGYRILPYEQRKFFKYASNQGTLVLHILYGRPSQTQLMKDIVYDKNPFLAMIKKQSPGAIPIIYGNNKE